MPYGSLDPPWRHAFDWVRILRVCWKISRPFVRPIPQQASYVLVIFYGWSHFIWPPLTILTPPIETPDPPFMTASKPVATWFPENPTSQGFLGQTKTSHPNPNSKTATWKRSAVATFISHRLETPKTSNPVAQTEWYKCPCLPCFFGGDSSSPLFSHNHGSGKLP